jgi:glycosyltransferase involved in cell wall biosynthesis
VSIRVLHLAPLWNSFTHFSFALAPAAKEDGYEFLYGCADPPADSGAIVLPLQRKEQALLSWTRTGTITSDLARAAPDIIHVHGPSTALALWPSLRQIAVPKVYSARSSLDEGGSYVRRAIWRFSNPALWRTWSAVSVLNQTQYRDVLLHGRSPVFLFKMSSGGTGIHDGDEDVRPRADLDPLTLIWIGRLDAAKHPEDFVHLVHSLNDDHIKTQGIVLGDALPGDRGGSRSRRMLADDPYIDWRGWVDDPMSHLREAHLLIHTSEREGYGMGPLEAAAVGVPTIAYWTRGTAESVLSVAGQLVRPRDRAGLKAACVEWVTGDRHAHQEEVRRRASIKFEDDIWKELDFLYRRVLSRNAHPRRA